MSTTVQFLLSAGIITVLITQLIVTVREVWRDRLDRTRERNGLLRILYSEFHRNQGLTRVASTFFQANMEEEHKKRAAKRHLAKEPMSKRAWEDTRVKLAHYLPSSEFAILDSLYRNVADLQPGALEDLETYSEGRTHSSIHVEHVSLALVVEIQQR